ncbi:Protease 2 [Camellia lanceoleosa]|uniref:Protease 2 n=1 Tax=Camellia lanceoleosa TaxID=1840588 RepID=A0ACC0FYM1_9ERIC|nr:Protease 2 [Camellia lanceoleosa]
MIIALPLVKIQGIQLFKDHLVIYEREKGLPKVTIYGLPPIGEPLERLHGGRAVDFIDPVYSVDPSESQFSSSILRFSYSSLRTPYSVYDYDMNTGISVLKKIETVLGGFDALNYVTERQWATAPDGTQIPISIVYQRNIVKLDGSDPLLLSGYGSYEYCLDPDFKASRLSLLDRGFIYAIAHIRGVVKWGGSGGSAGRLLIGAALNMRPDLFKVAVAEVPFVDVLTTMLDPTIPLTTSEWEEWGDPRKEEFYFYMKSYSPVDNIKAQNYPAILVTAGLHDTRVMYSEPAKFVAKLRDMKTDDNMLLFKCEFGAGHSSKSGRFEKLQEDAFSFAFIMKALNMVPPISSDVAC